MAPDNQILLDAIQELGARMGRLEGRLDRMDTRLDGMDALENAQGTSHP